MSSSNAVVRFRGMNRPLSPETLPEATTSQSSVRANDWARRIYAETVNRWNRLSSPKFRGSRWFAIGLGSEPFSVLGRWRRGR